MGLGSTAKKLQTVADLAEKLYAKVNEIRERVEAMQGAVQTTEERVKTLERDLAEQRAIVEAMAEAEGIDVAAVVDDVDHDGDEPTDETAGDAGESPADTTADGDDSTTVDGDA
ncbi:DUF5798 family protein [Halobaculum sp. CBA1158]|uniref:DUF5798 family protein n=1 Tax=Halobaculum sp. CBA1158 TaxID=2904243 RepID=UPI001F18924D|nr:DUF5798 family protein [Halobaculum sp. CBA1158]UIO99241.1 DUF5798 family protein [Halobaculum sp. CBA1158]